MTSPGTAQVRSRRSDRAFCRALLPDVSRTFAISIEALPPSLRDAVRAAYLLCRVVDTIEDEAELAAESRVRLFDVFDRLIEDDSASPDHFEELAGQLGLAQDTQEGRLCRGAGAVFRAFRELPRRQRTSIRGPVQTMSRGMREYCDRADATGGLELRDLADLERYCYFVAGTVGELLTALFEDEVANLSRESREALRERAVSFGLGLQLVNIVKDVATDHERGDCFLPVELAHHEGLALEHLLDPEQRSAGLRVVGAVCQRARHHLERASEYTGLWPAAQGAPVRLFCIVPLALALATLREVETGDETLRPGRVPKIDRQQVGRILQKAAGAAQSNEALQAMLAGYG